MSFDPPANAFTVGGGVYPLFVITCMVCGYTVFVNALVSGILSRPEGLPAKEGQE
jgi:hypothetical protein